MSTPLTYTLRRRSRLGRWLQAPRVFCAHYTISRRAKINRWPSAVLAARLTWPLL